MDINPLEALGNIREAVKKAMDDLGFDQLAFQVTPGDANTPDMVQIVLAMRPDAMMSHEEKVLADIERQFETDDKMAAKKADHDAKVEEIRSQGIGLLKDLGAKGEGIFREDREDDGDDGLTGV